MKRDPNTYFPNRQNTEILLTKGKGCMFSLTCPEVLILKGMQHVSHKHPSASINIARDLYNRVFLLNVSGNTLTV